MADTSHAPKDRGGMDWIIPFYGWRGARMGPTGIFDSHRARAASIARLCGSGTKRVLDLGAGAGGTAAAIADLGHDVVAIELEPVRAGFARDLAAERRAGDLTILEANYFEVALDGLFDVIGHWDSFGMGADTDQQQLLRRIAGQWLARDGHVLLDVFNPIWWAVRHGQVTRHDWCGMIELHEFDPIAMRFIDTWWIDGDEAHAHAQTARCYSPADFALLLEGTGLVIRAMEVNGTPLPTVEGWRSMAQWQDEAFSYHVVLARTDGTDTAGASDRTADSYTANSAEVRSPSAE
ncbi:MAG: methyltransferase domain-containing protein [Ktedonobacterales bacterium]|nr:methyltransferase domain-containing protein [Ktedonobacterales bacterium]